MPADAYEIRVCLSCGLRYPLVSTHAETFGVRCPACLGETRVALRRRLAAEPGRAPPESVYRGDRQPAGEQGRYKEKGTMLAVLLDNIRSAWNTGSILRSADGFGFAHVYLCGITPTPEGPGGEAVRKTSLGAQDSVPWSYHKDALKLVKGLKKEGWRICALEKHERGIPLTRGISARFAPARFPDQRYVLLVGNEVTGVDPALIDLCDRIYSIPMRGEKHSFNVAIAFAIAAYALTEN